MNEKTVSYLKGRFGDYYRSVDIPLPPEYENREWGFIPWTETPGDHMVRHLSHLNMGEDLYDFMIRKRPQHMYFSAAKYKHPGAAKMEDKEWTSSDLVFDLDADPQHMEIIDADNDSYKEMLEKCKTPLKNLLDMLENEFGFTDITVSFSGGRGYHVHVRDEEIQTLGRQERSEIINYVYGRGFDTEIRSGPTHISDPQFVYRTQSGWYKKVYEKTTQIINQIEQLPREEAIQNLQTYRLQEGEAEEVYEMLQKNKGRILAGNITTQEDSPLETFISNVIEEVTNTHKSEVDEPVTTDINRLIRLPGSLHGGSGLQVTQIDPDEIDEFKPLTDAIPDKFKKFEIEIEVLEETKVELNEEKTVYSEGKHTVPEYIGLYLMANGAAEKVSEN